MENLGLLEEVYSFEGLNFVDNGVKAIFSVKQEEAEFFDAYISFDVSDKGVPASMFMVVSRTLINNDLLEKLKNESINSTPVPSLMVQTGGESQIEFAKETELANTRFNTMIASYKIDLNRDITKLYRKILRWETDIDPTILKNLKYILRMPAAKTLGVTVEMVNNFKSLLDVLMETFMRQEEVEDKDGKPTEVARQFKKLVLHEFIPQLDIDHFDDLVDQARDEANKLAMKETSTSENILDSGLEEATEETF